MPITLEDVIDEYLADRKRALRLATLRWYRGHLGRFCSWCLAQNPPVSNLSDLNRRTVEKFLGYLAENDYSGNTCHGYAQVIKSFVLWTNAEEDYSGVGMSIKQMQRVPLPHVPEADITVFTVPEIGRLFEACATMDTDFGKPQRNRAILAVLLDTGLRASELCHDDSRPTEHTGLRLGRTFIESKDSDPRAVVYGKGNKERWVGLGNVSTRYLRTYIRSYRPVGVQHDYVFCGRGNNPLSVRGLEDVLARLGNAAGVQNVHPHRLRHHFAVSWLQANGDLYGLMRLLGHQNLKTTQMYLRAVDMKAVRAKKSVVDEM